MTAPDPGALLPPDKHRLPALTDPAEHAAYVRARHPGADLTHTAGVVLLYQSWLAAHAARGDDTRPMEHWVSADLQRTRDDVVLCSGFGRGAPAAGLILEQLIALGAPAVITIGTAAALTRDLQPGALVICRDAARGEGLSHHYLAPDRYVTADTRLTALLQAEAEQRTPTAQFGRTWTTDALYRESTVEVQQHAAEGVLAADMEAAGVLAVARYRHVPAAAGMVIADSLACRAPRTDSLHTREGLVSLLEAAIHALARPTDTERGGVRVP
ncbi:nucleoside phosphorylase [Streptomyces sp. NPDC058471]|uniref:nucleoside phosphorylase n=1 Tax=Streptomyces sp. NPDC058471 TaxID=3346516 RepID=UPI00365EC83B